MQGTMYMHTLSPDNQKHNPHKGNTAGPLLPMGNIRSSRKRVKLQKTFSTISKRCIHTGVSLLHTYPCIWIQHVFHLAEILLSRKKRRSLRNFINRLLPPIHLICVQFVMADTPLDCEFDDETEP